MRKAGLFVLVALLFLAMQAGNAADESLDLQVRYGRSYSTYVVNADGTATESHEWSMTLLKESAIEWAKRASISYSTSAQRAEIVEAYTVKADGRRIEVQKNNYQMEINQGRGTDAPAISDISSLSVIFPDVAVGDSVVFSYRLVQTDPLFPGHFSVAQEISSAYAFDDYKVRFDYPASLWVQYNARGMKESHRGESNGRKVIEWSYSNPQPVQSDRKNYSVYDPEKETGFAFSTFRTYGEIAAAYGTRALPKAAVTERVRSLAAQIVGDTIDRREQARLIYEWVAKNITYGGNCIGIGAVVPRDIPFVLDNKMGDCKDHATLLQALLAARGIRSAQALINAGSVYGLPKVPVVSTVNHVINYFPEFDLFVDSTSNSTPFGMLPFQVQDKPVLLVEGFKDGVRTPVPPVGSNAQEVKIKLAIGDKGAISGSMNVVQKGEGAVQTRAWARTLTREWEADFIKDSFRQQGQIGTGKFYKDDPTALTADYHYATEYTLEKFTKFPGSGAFYIHPVVAAGSSVHGFVAYAMEPEKEADVACTHGALTEEYEIVLPTTMKVLSIPDDLSAANDHVSYNATYRLSGNVLTARRAIEVRIRGNVCSPQVMGKYQEIGEKIMDDLKAQVLYK